MPNEGARGGNKLSYNGRASQKGILIIYTYLSYLIGGLISNANCYDGLMIVSVTYGAVAQYIHTYIRT